MVQHGILNRAMEPKTIRENSKKPIRWRNFFFALLAACVIYSGCDDKEKGEEQHKKGSKLEKVNIGNAKFIFQHGSSSTTKSTNSDGYSFYKTDENGNIEPIVFIDGNGDTLSHQITKIVDVNSDFLFFRGIFPTLDENGNPVTYHNILVNKKTEKIYALPNSFYIPNDFQILSDKIGNLYVIVENNVYKIDTVNNTIENYLPQGQGGGNILVDKNGFCYFGSFPNDKIKHPSGKLTLVSDLTTIDAILELWDDWWNNDNGKAILGNDGYIYYLKDSKVLDKYIKDYAYYTLLIYRIDNANDDIKATLITNQPHSFYFMLNHFNDCLLFLNAEKLSELSEFDIVKNQWRYFQIPNDFYNRMQGKQQFISKNAVYFFDWSTKRDFVRLDLTTYEISTITLTGYEIYGVTSSINSAEISFTGLRYADSKIIVGSIDASGNVNSIIERENNQKIENLIQLN